MNNLTSQWLLLHDPVSKQIKLQERSYIETTNIYIFMIVFITFTARTNPEV